MPIDDDSRAAHRGRHWSRRLALQALYQWDVSGGDAGELIAQFTAREEHKRADSDYFAALIEGVVQCDPELKDILAPVLDRPLHRLDPVERTVLRFGCYELMHCPDVPGTVVLAEATQLASRFGTENGGKYVNAVLDKIARDLRRISPHE